MAMTAVIVAAGIGLLIVLVLVLINRFVSSTGRAAVEEADRLLEGERIVLREAGAPLFGIRSLGPAQIRGNGVLTLTDRRLHFLMWLPRRELSIPRERIVNVEIPKSFMGKSIFRDLLQVNFINEDGEADAAAWAARDPLEWQAFLSSTAADG